MFVIIYTQNEHPSVKKKASALCQPKIFLISFSILFELFQFRRLPFSTHEVVNAREKERMLHFEVSIPAEHRCLNTRTFCIENKKFIRFGAFEWGALIHPAASTKRAISGNPLKELRSFFNVHILFSHLSIHPHIANSIKHTWNFTFSFTLKLLLKPVKALEKTFIPLKPMQSCEKDIPHSLCIVLDQAGVDDETRRG